MKSLENEKTMTINEYFGLKKTQKQLNFVNLNVLKDNRFYFSPRAIEESSDPEIIKMNISLKKYFGKIFEEIKNRNFSLLIDVLSGIHETSYLRSGYSTSIGGNSLGKKLKANLLNSLISNKLTKKGILNNFSDLELFVDEISVDRISDIIASVITPHLIDFTIQQCKLLSIKLDMRVDINIYNFNISKWELRGYDLPSCYGFPLLLMPKSIVRKEGGTQSSIGFLYRFAIHDILDNYPELINGIKGSGKNGDIILNDIKEKYPSTKANLVKFVINNSRLLVDFKSKKMLTTFKPLSDSEIEEIVSLKQNETA
jgi:hypothetical protein